MGKALHCGVPVQYPKFPEKHPTPGVVSSSSYKVLRFGVSDSPNESCANRI
jgi:hypothetical protein